MPRFFEETFSSLNHELSSSSKVLTSGLTLHTSCLSQASFIVRLSFRVPRGITFARTITQLEDHRVARATGLYRFRRDFAIEFHLEDDLLIRLRYI